VIKWSQRSKGGLHKNRKNRCFGDRLFFDFWGSIGRERGASAHGPIGSGDTSARFLASLGAKKLFDELLFYFLNSLQASDDKLDFRLKP